MIGVILLTLAGSFAWLWYKHEVDQAREDTRAQATEAATALEDGEDLLGEDIDHLRQATVGSAVVIVIRNAQGKVLGQMPEAPDFSTEEIHDPVWKKAQEGQSEHGKMERISNGADYYVYARRVKPPDKLADTPTASARW